MCVIIGCCDKKPPFSIVEKCHAENSHGIGLVWFNSDGKSEYKKWLYPFEIQNIIKNIDLPFIMHFRAASLGMGKNNTLNHPFIISEDSPLSLTGTADKLLVHNGTIKEYEKLLKIAEIKVPDNTPISDTRAIAMILAKIGDDEGQDSFLKHLTDNSNQKFVIIDSVIKKFKMFGKFEWEDGCFYSNMDWKTSKRRTYWQNQEYDNITFNNIDIPVKNVKKETQVINYDIPEASPLYLQVKKITNGINCGFCGIAIDALRINKLRILGYAPDEMNCLECCKELNIENYIPESFSSHSKLLN